MLGALLLSACGEEAPEPPPQTKRAIEAPASDAAAAPADRQAEPVAARPTSAPAADGQDAAQILEAYYALIEAGDYVEAYRLREPQPNVTPSMFAGNFARYAAHQATIGRPSEPVQAGDWLYVEVPVQTYGQLKNGLPFGSAGTVTLRRKASGGAWRVYTKS